MKPEMLEAKIAFYEQKHKILKSAARASVALTDRISSIIKDTHTKQYDLIMKQVDRECDAIRDELEAQPVNFALTPAGIDTISRSLDDTAILFAVDSNGQCTSHELSR